MSALPVCHLAVVACGNRLSETLVLLKSAVLLSRAKLFFHIFADDDLQPLFKQAVSGRLSSCQTGGEWSIVFMSNRR